MATVNEKVKSAEKALQVAKQKYSSAASTAYVKPDYELKRKKANEAYAAKLRATNKKKKAAEAEGLQALDKLKAAYQKKRQDAVYDSIDHGIQRSSIVKGQLDAYNRAQSAEEKETVNQVEEVIREYDEQLGQYRLDKDYKLYEIDQDEKEWEQKDQQRKTKAALKRQLEQKQAEYKAAVKEQQKAEAAAKKAEAAAKKQSQSKAQTAKKQQSSNKTKEQATNKQQSSKQNKDQEDLGVRPDYIPQKYWERVKQAYQYLKEKKDADAEQYLSKNAYRLRIQLGEGGFYWLHKKLGLL